MCTDGPAGAKELISPRITSKYLESLIVHEEYHHFPVTCTTVCTVKVLNNFSITESVVCANPELYNEEAGKRAARKKVFSRLQELEYYLLKQRLHDHQLSSKGEPDGK
jgi:hypothetical protein